MDLGNTRFEAPYVRHDRCMIGPRRDRNWRGCFNSFSDMAKQQKISFLNLRTSQTEDPTITNSASLDQNDNPFVLESIGIRFVYPGPLAASVHTFEQTHQSQFVSTIAEHCTWKFFIENNEYTDSFITAPFPSGYGTAGAVSVASNNSSLVVDHAVNGTPHISNRQAWLPKGIDIGKSIKMKAELIFSEYGKYLLDKMGNVRPLENEDGFIDNMAFIEFSLRGKRSTLLQGNEFSQVSQGVR